jgi:hypothetical protein
LLAAQQKYAQPVMTHWICDERARAADYREQLAAERRDIAAAGVKPDRDRREYMINIVTAARQADDRADGYEKVLRARYGVGPLPCGCVDAVLACDRANEDCRATLEDLRDAEQWGQLVMMGKVPGPVLEDSEENPWPDVCRRAAPKRASSAGPRAAR